jgi:hypothetical protein
LEERNDSVEFDPRFLAVLVEVCRNRSRHARSSEETATVQVALDREGETAEIAYDAACYINDFKSIAERLQRTRGNKWRGVNFIAHFVESIAPGQSVTQWRFTTGKGKTDDLQDLPLDRKRAGAAQVKAPEWLLEDIGANELDQVPDLIMRFRAETPDPLCE